MVWLKSHVPRMARILWMAFKCKMLTREKVKQWGCVGDDDCALYHRTVETRDRLFFYCDYAKNIGE